MTKEEKAKLFYKPINGHDELSAAEEAEMNAYCEDYKKFLDASKTERECVFSAIRLAEKRGFVEYRPGMAIQPGDKVYYNNRGKAIMLAVIGSQSLAKGANIGAAHTDAPRLDIKPRPLFQASHAEMAYLKTHYYGGIRKYQWVATPLELHGKVMRRDGSEVYVKIGADLNDPQFIISDLLPHLGAEQGAKPLNSAIPAESLNILIGSWPERDDDSSDRVSLAILKLLHEKYGIIEEDLFYEEKGYQYLTANFTPDGYDCVREKFLGVYGTEDHPAGLERGTLEGSTELGGNHCGSLQKNFKLQPGEEARFVIMLGEGNREEGRRIRVNYSDLKRVDAVYTDLAAYWKQKYAALQIQTPNEGMNTLINTWTLYQSEINDMFEGC